MAGGWEKRVEHLRASMSPFCFSSAAIRLSIVSWSVDGIHAGERGKVCVCVCVCVNICLCLSWQYGKPVGVRVSLLSRPVTTCPKSADAHLTSNARDDESCVRPFSTKRRAQRCKRKGANKMLWAARRSVCYTQINLKDQSEQRSTSSHATIASVTSTPYRCPFDVPFP